MCTSLQNTHKAEFPQDMDAQGMAAQDMAAQDMAVQDMDAQGMDAPEVDFFMSEYTFMHVSFGSC
jgi:hypothetical protein